MAVNVNNYLAKLRTFNVEKETATAIKKQNRQIVEINQINLDKGLDNQDGLVGLYSAATAEIAKSNPKPNQSKEEGQPFNFDWTGAFLNGMYIVYRNNKITFLSKGMGSGEKKSEIIKNKLLGVSEKGAEIINNDIIKPMLQTSFKNHIRK